MQGVAEQTGGKSVADLAKGLWLMSNATASRISDNLSPGGKRIDKGENSFWEEPFSSFLGNTAKTGAPLAIMSVVPGGIYGKLLAGGTLNVAQTTDAAFGWTNKLSDAEKQEQLPFYKYLRNEKKLSEADADKALHGAQMGLRDYVIAAGVGMLTMGAPVRILKGGATVAGGAGFAKRVLSSGAELGTLAGVQGAQTDIAAQQGESVAKSREGAAADIDWNRTLASALTSAGGSLPFALVGGLHKQAPPETPPWSPEKDITAWGGRPAAGAVDTGAPAPAKDINWGMPADAQQGELPLTGGQGSAPPRQGELPLTGGQGNAPPDPRQGNLNLQPPRGAPPAAAQPPVGDQGDLFHQPGMPTGAQQGELPLTGGAGRAPPAQGELPLTGGRGAVPTDPQQGNLPFPPLGADDAARRAARSAAARGAAARRAAGRRRRPGQLSFHRQGSGRIYSGADTVEGRSQEDRRLQAGGPGRARGGAGRRAERGVRRVWHRRAEVVVGGSRQYVPCCARCAA